MKTKEIMILIEKLKQGNHLSIKELDKLKIELEFLLICTKFRIEE